MTLLWIGIGILMLLTLPLGKRRATGMPTPTRPGSSSPASIADIEDAQRRALEAAGVLSSRPRRGGSALATRCRDRDVPLPYEQPPRTSASRRTARRTGRQAQPAYQRPGAAAVAGWTGADDEPVWSPFRRQSCGRGRGRAGRPTRHPSVSRSRTRRQPAARRPCDGPSTTSPRGPSSCRRSSTSPPSNATTPDRPRRLVPPARGGRAVTVGDLVRHRAARRAVLVGRVLTAFVPARPSAVAAARHPSPSSRGPAGRRRGHLPPTPRRSRPGPGSSPRDASVDGATAQDARRHGTRRPRTAPKAPVRRSAARPQAPAVRRRSSPRPSPRDRAT